MVSPNVYQGDVYVTLYIALSLNKSLPGRISGQAAMQSLVMRPLGMESIVVFIISHF